VKKKTADSIHALLKNFAQKSLKDYDIEKLKKHIHFTVCFLMSWDYLPLSKKGQL
jgi:hypothetical protein